MIIKSDAAWKTERSCSRWSSSFSNFSLMRQSNQFAKLWNTTPFINKRSLVSYLTSTNEHTFSIAFHFTYFSQLQCWHIAIYKRIALFLSSTLMNWKHWQFDLASRIFQTLWFHGEYHTRANQITSNKVVLN